jgi:hypothetical protein
MKMIQNTKTEKKIVPVFLINGVSTTIIIPKKIARNYVIDRPCHVSVQETDNGILIKKAEFQD